MTRSGFCFLLLFLSLAFSRLDAQNQQVLNPQVIQQSLTKAQAAIEDTLPETNIQEEDLDHIIDLRSQFEKQNRYYRMPSALSESLLKFLKKDELEMSDEALYWAHWVRDPATVISDYATFSDTILVSPLFMPILFKGDFLPHDLTFYNLDSLKQATPYDKLYPTDTLFREVKRRMELDDMAYKYVQNNFPTSFRYSMRDLPTERLKPNVIKKTIYEDIPLKVEAEASFEDVEAPTKFIPERRYWTSKFESSIQFAQNYISPNWHKGGNSSLNLNNREFLQYNYERDRIKFTNELELKNNVYTSPNDTLRNYKVSDDVFRLRSNFGYKAFSKWYYTLTMEFRTQLLSSYEENSDVKQSGLLSPYSYEVGLGMQYSLSKQFTKNKHKKLEFNINIDPISFKFRQTIDKDIRLDKHFKQDEKTGEYPTKENQLGSNIDAVLDFRFNRDISWYSHLKYNTSYHRIEAEWENRFVFAWSRFFSTNISLSMRYDDGVAKVEDFNSHLQINELLSFGFNYRW